MSDSPPTSEGDGGLLEPVCFASGVLTNTFMGAPIRMRCPLCGETDMFASNEHYFHACKAALLTRADRHEYYAAIRDAVDPRTDQPSWRMAKHLGRTLPLDEGMLARWDWVEGMSAMLRCNLAKYAQHASCRAVLLDTGDRPLVEHRPDEIWGDNMDGSGMNLFGKTLELVRARMRGVAND